MSNHTEAERIRTDGAYSGVIARLWRFGRDGRKWLSQKTPSLNEIKRNRGPSITNPTWGDRLRLSLYRLHSIQATSIFSGTVLVGVLILAVIASYIVADETIHKLEGLPELSLSIAGVLGGVIGILIAVIVFAVQYHGEPSRDASQLMRFLIRWEALVPIAGLTLAFVTAQVLAAIIGTLWWDRLLYGMAIIDLVGVPLAVWTTVYLFHRMLYSITADFFTQGVLPGLTVEYMDKLDRDSRWMQMSHALHGKPDKKSDVSSELGQLGVGLSPWGLFSDDNVLSVGPLRSGVIIDVNLHLIAQLVSVIRTEKARASLVLSAGLGKRLEDESPFHLKLDYSDPLAATQWDAQLDTVTLHRLCNKAIRVRARNSEELDAMLSAIIASAIERIRGGAWREADQVTRVILLLHERRMQRPDRDLLDADEINFTGFLSGGENIYEIAHAAAESKRPEIVDVVCKFALRLAVLALTHDAKGLFNKSIGLISVVYFGLASSRNPQVSSIRRIDSWIGSLPNIDLQLNKSQRPDANYLRPYREIAIAETVGMARNAFRFGHTQDALDFHQRAVQIVKYQKYRNDDRTYDSELLSQLFYAQILLAGWGLELVRRSIVKVPELIEFINGLIQECRELNIRNPWLDAWDVRSSRRSASRFGEDHWIDDLRRWRTGVPYSSSMSSEWVFHGLILLLLMKPPINHVRITATPEYMPRDEAALSTAISGVLAVSGIYGALTQRNGETDGDLVNKLDEHKKEVLRAFEIRRMLRKKADMEKAVLLPVQEEILEVGLESAQTILEQKIPGWLSLRTLSQNCVATSPFPIRSNRTALRRWYIDVKSTLSNLGEIEAESLQNYEQFELFWAVERNSKSVGVVKTIDELKEKIRQACIVLQQKGYQPDVLFFPHQPRFANEVTGHARWRRLNLDPDRRGHHGIWHGLNIYDIPYHNTEVVVVADSSKLWSAHSISGNHLKFSLTDHYEKHNVEHLEIARNATIEAEVPSVDEVKIVENWKLIPRFGYADIDAARHIQLDLSVFGYGMLKGTEVYHQPTCHHLMSHDDVCYSLSKQLSEEKNSRKPCRDCNPDEWDWREEDGA